MALSNHTQQGNRRLHSLCTPVTSFPPIGNAAYQSSTCRRRSEPRT